jgi:C4-dicarboxylate transporter
VVSLAAAGRTMSPVAAVVLMAKLTNTEPLAVVRRVALPLLAGIAAVVAVLMG